MGEAQENFTPTAAPPMARALDRGRGGAGMNVVGVVEAGRTRSEKAEVAVHRVLVEGDEEVEAVAHVGDGVGTGANGEEGVAAANDGLIGVVGVQVKATAAEDFCEDITWSGGALASPPPLFHPTKLPHTIIPSPNPPPPPPSL